MIFEKIRLTGFLNYIQKHRVAEYVDAVKEIIKELAALNFPVDLATMTEKSRNHFLEEFPRQIKAAFPASGQSRMQFFKPEITPKRIKAAASHIAQSIKFVMDSIETQILDDEQDNSRGIPLTDISSHSVGKSHHLQELLIHDDDEYQEPKTSRCCVM